VAVRHPTNAEARDQALGELEALLAAEVAPATLPGSPPIVLEEIDRDQWSDLIEKARQFIRDGKVRQLTVARHSLVKSTSPIDPVAVLTKLAARYPDCYRFSIRRGDLTLIGASAQRLVARQGLDVYSDALAGCIAEGARASDRLLASAMARDQLEMVVHAIESQLNPLCTELQVVRPPAIRRQRHFLHLTTPISGRLAAPHHILNLVAALHPTPATAGDPARDAADWVRDNEPTSRGWFSGPIGWFDPEGNGEFAAAVGAGLIQGRDAHIFSSVGVSRQSDAETVYEQSGLKQRALLDALGAST
jgi:isochorismate synthase EntC